VLYESFALVEPGERVFNVPALSDDFEVVQLVAFAMCTRKDFSKVCAAAWAKAFPV